MMLTISRSHFIHIMAAENVPCLKLPSGSKILFETTDALGGRAKEYFDRNLRSTDSDFFANPATGPVYINEANPGDTLEIEIIDIELNEEGFIYRNGSIFGKYGGNRRDYVPVRVDDGMLIYGNRRIPAEPMIGVIGTAPLQPVSCRIPGDHGGNMDTRMIRKGAKVFLPVFVEGALLALGDVHAVMGEGEVCGQGIEIGADVLVSVKVLKNDPISRPRVMDHEKIAFIASAPSIGEATKIVLEDLGQHYIENIGMSFEDVFGMALFYGNLVVSQIVNPLMTVRYEIEKKYLELFI